MADSKHSGRAIVTYPAKDGHADWKLEKMTISRDIKPDEVLVRMVASGICEYHLEHYSASSALLYKCGLSSLALGQAYTLLFRTICGPS